MSAPGLADLTAAVLGPLLGTELTDVVATPVGTGQIGTAYRLALAGPEVGDRIPTSVLAKLPAADAGSRALLAGAYRGEIRFYRDIAPTVAIRVPGLVYASEVDDDGGFLLVLEDLAPARQGDQIAGATPAQVRDAVVNLAGLHGPRWCDPTLLEIEHLTLNGPDDAALLAELYGPATELFVDGLGALLDDDTIATLRACPPVVEAWALGRRERFGLVHGDYRLDNLLFPPDLPDQGSASIAVDWQTLSLALPARDLAYVVATSLDAPVRREVERDLVAAYHHALAGFGVEDHPPELAWEDYRYAMLQGPLVAVFGCAYGTRSERGDAMFAAMVTRACAAVRDLGTLDLIG
ncbi:phosphotransferase family protein [Nocardioides sp.]|uniref:phosphotransferase family protein n=1 Tax=Nocardioides sp. TaxID=35761 RepID=UPI003516FA3F